MRVEIYWNLHKKMYSVRDAKTGRVVAHTYQSTIKDAEFVVRQSGNRKVRETGVKNVHAFVRGELRDLDITDEAWDWDRITYNPYKYTSFVHVNSEHPIRKAQMAYLMTRLNGAPLITAFRQEG